MIILPELTDKDGKPIVMSFLQLNDYLTCPKRFGHRHYFHDAFEKKSRQQMSGIGLHDLIKRRFKLQEPLPNEHGQLEPVCEGIINRGDILDVELALGSTVDGRPCSFFDDSCRLRSRIDLSLMPGAGASPNVAAILDWKEGRPWEDPLELKIQSLLLKIHKPQLEVVTGFYFWIREHRPGTLYDLSDFAGTWNNLSRWMTGIKFRIEHNDWPPDEGPLCGWCPVTKQQCAFKRDRKT